MLSVDSSPLLITMEYIAGALVSAFIEALFEKLRSSELLNFGRQEKLISETEDWKTLLEVIKDLLEDAEERQITERSEKRWLDDLRDLAYDIEDVLDEFTDALERQNTLLLSFITGLLPASFEFKREMELKIKDITKRMQRLIPEQPPVNFKRIARETPNNPKERPPTTSLVEESDICGRNDDKKALVDMLLKHEGGSNRMSVIPILGMGGIGKTTLAQLVYHDTDVKAYFNIRVWASVSQNFNVVVSTRTILRSIDPEIPGLQYLDLNLLQEKLKEKLSGKKILLILDDLWEEDRLPWGMLCSPFAEAAAGSKIVITTRKMGVASMAGTVLPYSVKELPDGECLSLLARHALPAQNFDSHSPLKHIAERLVKKCKGLPLAVKVLGGLLRNKSSPLDWELVLKSDMWNLSKTRTNGVLPVLKFSYNDLPSCLKRCFVYCAIFPKGYEFDRNELVLLWMAEGFLHSPQIGKQMEDIGIDYFEDLVSRSLFQSSSKDLSRYVMHDLISELAQSIGGEIYYNYENKFESSTSNSNFEKVRHASYMFRNDNDFREYAAFTPMKSLRTLLRFPMLESYFDKWDGNTYDNEFCKLLIDSKYLRVLSLTHSGMTTLPDSIEDLKLLRHLNLSFTEIEQLPESVDSLLNLHTLLLHSCMRLKSLPNRIGKLINLRHLNLSFTEIEQLPESVRRLFNLHTLLLRSCKRLQKLPGSMERLSRLRHLDVSDTPQLQEIPSSTGELINLQTLSKFVVSEWCGTRMSGLKNLNNLCGILSIEGLHNVTNTQDAKLANLKEKQGLEELVFKWKHHDGGNDMLVLKSLEPHQNLKRLTIFSYGGSELPSWVSDPSFSNLESLKLWSCKEILILPELHNHRHLFELDIRGCSSLESLALTGLPPSLKTIIVSDCGSLERFPIIDTHDNQQSLLEDLKIYDCPSLRHFATNFKLPISLKKFVIHGCCHLLSLPDELMTLDDNVNPCQSHLKDLKIIQCKQLLTFFPAGKLPALQCLVIEQCPNLLSLPHQMDTQLPSLRKLRVSGCRLASLTRGGGLPKNLTSLCIQDCVRLSQPIAEWGLHLLSSLELFEIGGSAVADEVLFLDNNLCPTSLITLEIGEFMNLKSVGCGLRTLAYLQFLTIKNCPQLLDLPVEALPSHIRGVHIHNCPLLKDHYNKNTGEYPSSIIFHDL